MGVLRVLRQGLLLCCCAWLSACGAENHPVPLAPLSADAVLLAFGDSLTYGAGVDSEESYPKVLSRLIQRKVINAGVSGETSAQGLARLPDTLDGTRPDLLILIHGGNDFLRKLPETSLKNNLSKMISLARDRNIPVVMMSVPKPAIFLKPSEIYDVVATQHAVALELGGLSEILADRSLKSDQIHPNAAGYRRMAEKIQALLAASGAISSPD